MVADVITGKAESVPFLDAKSPASGPTWEEYRSPVTPEKAAADLREALREAAAMYGPSKREPLFDALEEGGR
jgi:hypothetical protein